MSGSVAGGLKASVSNKSKYGEDFYRKIGAIGGKKGTTGGFYANRELASEAGRKGGTISKRGPAKRYKSKPDRAEELLLDGDLVPEERLFISDDDNTPTIDIDPPKSSWSRLWSR